MYDHSNRHFNPHLNEFFYAGRRKYRHTGIFNRTRQATVFKLVQTVYWISFVQIRSIFKECKAVSPRPANHQCRYSAATFDGALATNAKCLIENFLLWIAVRRNYQKHYACRANSVAQQLQSNSGLLFQDINCYLEKTQGCIGEEFFTNFRPGRPVRFQVVVDWEWRVQQKKSIDKNLKSLSLTKVNSYMGVWW